MNLTLKRAKRLLEGEHIRQTALILCDTPEEAADVLRAACCWLTHVEFQATPQSVAELEQAYLESEMRVTKDVIFPVDDDDNCC